MRRKFVRTSPFLSLFSLVTSIVVIVVVVVVVIVSDHPQPGSRFLHLGGSSLSRASPRGRGLRAPSLARNGRQVALIAVAVVNKTVS